MVLANFVFIIPISKNIFDMTGIDVIATPIAKTSLKEKTLFALPIKYG